MIQTKIHKAGLLVYFIDGATTATTARKPWIQSAVKVSERAMLPKQA
jgi:hypothetical protein